jgi:hypothetical protein
MFKKISYLLVLCCGISTWLHAQNSPIIVDSVRNEFIRINTVFDSAYYTAFKINIKYNTDTTVTGLFETDEQFVEYQVSRTNYYYKVQDMEFVQTDSFIITIDHADRRLIATPNTVSGDVASAFNIKEFVDYTINNYDSIYTFAITDIDSVYRQITFTTTDTTVQYNNFKIIYYKDDYWPAEIAYSMNELIALGVTDTSAGYKVRQHMRMLFSGIEGMPTGVIFNPGEYFYKDRVTKRYMPAEKFKYYEFITAGMNEDEQVTE